MDEPSLDGNGPAAAGPGHGAAVSPFLRPPPFDGIIPPHSFEQYSFHEVVVGNNTRKRMSGKKKASRSKKPYFYTGFVGPVVWDPKVEDSKFYVMKFLDGDVRRFRVNELEKYLLHVPLVGIFNMLHATLVGGVISNN